MEITGAAWQVRELQRQEFFQGLMRKVLCMEEKWHGRNFLGVLLADAACYMYGGEDLWTRSDIRKLLTDVVLSSLKEFARSKEEKEALFARFLEKYLLPAVAAGSYSKLSRQEAMHPNLIFHAEHASDEITIS